MKKILISFLVGVFVGSGGYWAVREGPLAKKVKESSIVTKVGEMAQEHAAGKLKEEMEMNKRIVMKKPAEATIPPLQDSLLGDLVKAKIAAEPMLAVAEIKAKVKDGEVELSGKAASYEQVARAMRLTMECDATRTAISMIEVITK